MSYSVEGRETESAGSMHYEKVILNIDSLANAGNEPVAATDETGLVDSAVDAHVAGQEIAGYTISYDHINDRINVTECAGASGQHADVAAGTDVGEIELVVVGT